MNVTPVGSGSVMTTPVAGFAPRFDAEMLYVNWLPCFTANGASFSTARSTGDADTTVYETETGVPLLPAASVTFTVKVLLPGVDVSTVLTTLPVLSVPAGNVEVPQVTTPESES